MNQDKFFKDLLDFSDLRRKNEEFSSTNSKSSSKSQHQELQIDLINNEKLIKSFKELREKLRESTRQYQNAREEMSCQQIQIKHLNDSERNLMEMNQQLKEKNHHLTQSNEEIKKRLSLLKETIKDKNTVDEELQYLKTTLVEIKLQNQQLHQEKNKIMEISIEDKMNLQAIIHKLQAKKNSDLEYVKEIQCEISKTKSNYLKMENQLKKMQIKYEEEVFNKNWKKQNYEKVHLENEMKSLEDQVNELKKKNRKQKQKRTDLQRRVLELEGSAGLCHVKAETYEQEVEMMEKKLKKAEKRMSHLKSVAEKATLERLAWEEKFMKCVAIAEEIISRVKRDLMGDSVELAKACQFKINKLKEKDSYQPRQTRELSTTKKTKSDKSKSDDIGNLTPTKCTKVLKYSESEGDDKVLCESMKNNLMGKNDGIEQAKISEKNRFQSSNLTFGNRQNDEMSTELLNIEIKIRKERDDMERKLKEKMLYRKIDLASDSEKYNLRADYLKFTTDTHF